MFTPGIIVDLSKDDENKFGLVIDSVDTCIKYLEISTDSENINPNSGIYNLLSDRVSFDRKIDSSLYLHLDVIHIADGEFKICGKMKSNQDFVEVMSYLNGYKNYSKMIGEKDEDIAQPNDAITLRKTV